MEKIDRDELLGKQFHTVEIEEIANQYLVMATSKATYDSAQPTK